MIDIEAILLVADKIIDEYNRALYGRQDRLGSRTDHVCA